MTRTTRFRALLAAAALLVCTWQLSAAPGFWQAATQADFLKGDVDQLSVDRHGRLARHSRVDIDERPRRDDVSRYWQ